MKNRPLESELYFRSDSRLPDEIFAYGFTPRRSMQNQDWWTSCLRETPNTRVHIPDADPENAVCMTTNFTSAAFFPVPKEFQKEESVTYIYAIALPSANKITTSAKLYDNQDRPADMRDAVIDFHSYQVANTANLMATYPDIFNKLPNLAFSVMFTSCAYEALTQRVPKENIMGAFKIVRNKHYLQTFPTPTTAVMGDPSIPYCEFKIDGYIENKNFVANQNLLIESENGQHTMLQLDHTTTLRNVLKFAQAMNPNETLRTPLALEGLGGKTFISPTYPSDIFLALPTPGTMRADNLHNIYSTKLTFTPYCWSLLLLGNPKNNNQNNNNASKPKEEEKQLALLNAFNS